MEKETKKNAKATKLVAKAKKKIDYSAIYDPAKAYAIDEAIRIIKQINKAKFDASLEVHFRLGIDPKKGDQQVRAAVSLPHGIGKTVKVAAFVMPENEAAVKGAGADYAGGDELIAEIKKTEKTDFQVAVAEPAMMKFQFINAPAKAAIPVSAPRMRATPISVSPMATSGPNQVYHPWSSMNWRKLRYQSKATGGRPSAGICTAPVQKPLSGSPVIQVPPLILPQPELSQFQPR